ncbi:MAG: AEC family transporter [Clostridia bacterium]|nr:AEC family transporter [Clostridia bacterium]
MITTFLATLTPMLTLFICIAIGFITKKAKLLPDNAGKVMAKLETWVFCPALSFSTMARYFTADSIGTHSINIIISSVGVAIALAIAIPLGKVFVPKNCSERGIYMYALAFANSGYIGDPVVLALFGEEALSYYKLYCLPISLVIYTWGISVLVPKGENNMSFFKKIFNAPTVAMLVGMLVGITGLGNHIPPFLANALDSLKGCMGPVAMLLAGFTIASYSFVGMLKKAKVYVATFLRLFIIPSVIIGLLFGFKTLLNLIFKLEIDNSALFLCFFATAAPLGLNTVVFPEAYGGNPETGASMAMISHTLAVFSIPVMYALMTLLFGEFSI